MGIAAHALLWRHISHYGGTLPIMAAHTPLWRHTPHYGGTQLTMAAHAPLWRHTPHYVFSVSLIKTLYLIEGYPKLYF